MEVLYISRTLLPLDSPYKIVEVLHYLHIIVIETLCYHIVNGLLKALCRMFHHIVVMILAKINQMCLLSKKKRKRWITYNSTKRSLIRASKADIVCDP